MSKGITGPFEITVFTITHRGKEGDTQAFTQIKLKSPTTANSKFDGVYFSEWMIPSSGSLFIAEDDFEVEYSAEYEGEDLLLRPLTHITPPQVDAENRSLANEMARVLQEETRNLFNVKIPLKLYCRGRTSVPELI